MTNLDAMCCKYCRRMTAKGDICVQKDCVCHKESPVSQTVEWNSNTFPNREDITRNLGAVSQTVEGCIERLAMAITHSVQGEYAKNETFVREVLSFSNSPTKPNN